MKMQKSPPELEQRLEAAFPDDPRAERRKMFGFSAGFVNGYHFGGLFEDHIVLRLGDADRQTLTAEHGAEPFAPMGHPMTGYVLAPPSIVEQPEQIRAWLQRAFDYAAALPPKAMKASRSTRASADIGRPKK
jgi:TfoX/Sxy family transcriptional regulator of competence genes